MLIYSCEQTLRKNRSGSVWQVRVVMWDVCLERNFSDYLSPISFFSCLVSAAWFWVEVFCFRFKRLTNQSGVALLISFDICNLTVRLRKKSCVSRRRSSSSFVLIIDPVRVWRKHGLPASTFEVEQ